LALVAEGVPVMVAVPLVPAVQTKPVGKVPVWVMVGAGVPPVAVTVKLNGFPVAAAAVAELVKAATCRTVMVRVWVAVPVALMALSCSG
jgi:hypothetical protein